jgi:Lon protease-like protein
MEARRKLHNINMPSALIPLFPLQVVVFPRTPLPLHIFEERYKKMVGAAIRDNSEFGVVLAREEGIENAGCTVLVEKVVETYADGRMDIVARGRRRFEIVSVNEEGDCLQAEVEFFEDDDTDAPPAGLRDQALRNFRELRELAGQPERGEPDIEDPQLSFQLAHGLPNLDFLDGLLRQRSETARLKQFNRFLAEYLPRQRTIERVRALAPTNGFGGKPAGI